MANAFNLWWLGNSSLEIRPFKKCQNKDFYRPKKPALGIEGYEDKLKKHNMGKGSAARMTKWKTVFNVYGGRKG